MFLLNPFTNDARVHREARSLIQVGYHVTILALTDPQRPELPTHEWQDGIEIYRITRTGPVFNFLRGIWYRVRGRRGAGVTPGVDDHGATPSAPAGAAGASETSVRRLLRFARRVGILWRMAMMAIRLKPDIYHAHDLNTLPAAVLSRLVRRRPLIYDAHEVATGRVGYDVWYMHLLERVCLFFCDRVITTTQTRARFLAEKYRFSPPPAVVGNVVDLTLAEVPARDLHRELNIPASEPIVIYQGGVQAGRGIEQVLESMPLWQKGYFVVVGDGRLMGRVQALAREYGVADRVRFTGRVPLKELLGYTKGADVGLQVLQNTCFNHYSTDSNKLFEYFAAGIPVIAADYPEIRQVVQSFDAGILIDPHDPRNIARAVNEVLTAPPEVRARWRANARRAAAHYNWDRESEKLIHLYKEILQGGKQPTPARG